MMKKKNTSCLEIVHPKRICTPYMVKKMATILACAGVLMMFASMYFGQKIISANYIKQIIPRRNVIPMRQKQNGGTGWESAKTVSKTTLDTSGLFQINQDVVKQAQEMFANSKLHLHPKNIKVQVFPDWPQVNPEDQEFTMRVYIYSAFISLHPHPPAPPPKGTRVHIVAFQEGRTLLPLKCCLRLPDREPVLGPKAELDFSRTPINKVDPPLRKHSTQVGMVYSCHFLHSRRQLRMADISLTSTSCPADSSEYLPIQEPELRPGSLGLCAKVLFGHELEARRLLEWFEIQRILGVDKIVLFDLNHSQEVDKVLRHYESTGLLLRLPYKLPDRPWGRDIRRGTTNDRFGDEQVLTTWDCRLRMAGYGWVLGLDFDEVAVARDFFYLKPYFRSEFKKRSNLAAIIFKVQFFIEEWGPVDPSSPVHMLQYLNSTVPWEARLKYVYVPARIHQPVTHQVIPFPGYKTKRAVPSTAILLHYRKCPFRNCTMPRITDRTLTHYREHFVPRVLSALRKVGLD